MPEGHTVHRLARLHRRRFAGAPVAVSSPQGRFAAGAAAVSGRVLRRAEAWGKHLFHHYDGAVVHIHLGLYGAFTDFAVEDDGGSPPPVGQVRMRMVGAGSGTDLRGPTACEVVTAAQAAEIVARLGPDPLRRDADPAVAGRRIAGSARPVGALLIDQAVVAGIGNVYRSEVLFRRGIDPYRPGGSLTEAEFRGLWADLVALLNTGVGRGKIVVVRPEHDHGPPPYARGKPRTYVYRRSGERCRVCATTVAVAELGGRNVFWCPGCQH